MGELGRGEQPVREPVIARLLDGNIYLEEFCEAPWLFWLPESPWQIHIHYSIFSRVST